MDDKSLGQIAFEAYKKAKGGTTYDNKNIPDWNNLGDDVRIAWEAAANAVEDKVWEGIPYR